MNRKAKEIDSDHYYPFPTEIETRYENHITLPAPEKFYKKFDDFFPLRLKKEYTIWVHDVDSEKRKKFEAVIKPKRITLSKDIYGWLNETHVVNQPLEVSWNNERDDGIKLRIKTTRTKRCINGKLPTWKFILAKSAEILFWSRVEDDDDVKQVKGLLVSIVEMVENNPPASLSVRQCDDMIGRTEQLRDRNVDVNWLLTRLKIVKNLKELAVTDQAMDEAAAGQNKLNTDIAKAAEEVNLLTAEADETTARLNLLQEFTIEYDKMLNQLKADTDKAADRVNQLKADPDEAAERVNQLKADPDEAAERVNQLRADPDEAAERVNQLKADQDEAAATQNRMKEAKDEAVARLKRQREYTVKAAARLDQLNAEADGAAARLDPLKAQLAMHAENYNALLKKKEELQAELLEYGEENFSYDLIRFAL